MSKFLDGIKVGFGIIFSFLILFSLSFALGFHSADEIIGGTFSGDYKFSGNVQINDLKLNDSNLICDLTREGSIKYNQTGKSIQLCNGTSWNILNAQTISTTLSEVEIPRTEGTLIHGTFYARAGNDYDGGGDDRSYASCAIYSGNNAGLIAYSGKQWTSSKLVRKVVITSSNDFGFQYDHASVNDGWTFYLEGSDDGSIWSTIASQTSANSYAKYVVNIENSAYSTKHLYHRVRGVKGGADVGHLMTLSETVFYEMK